MSDDVELDYAFLAQDALRGVVRSVLETTLALGMPPGEHHFYIEFSMNAPGVEVSGRLRAQYPDRMTIVLQHQFEGLEVHDDRFGVTLHFGGAPDHLVIPYAAITQFADPSASFVLQFTPPERTDEDDEDRPSAEVEDFTPAPRDAAEDDGDDDGPEDGGGGADVVSLDRFRKK